MKAKAFNNCKLPEEQLLSLFLAPLGCELKFTVAHKMECVTEQTGSDRTLPSRCRSVFHHVLKSRPDDGQTGKNGSLEAVSIMKMKD